MSIKIFAESADSQYWANALSIALDRDFEAVDEPIYADLVVFTGGTDVHPSLYEQDENFLNNINEMAYDIDRDMHNIELAKACLAKGTLMLGVCRGSQFLTAMFGGYLHQHIDGHTGRHSLEYGGKVYSVTSTHHQATSKLADSAKLLAKSDDGVIEAYHIPNKKVLGIQSHPEFEHEYDEHNTMGLLRQMVKDMNYLEGLENEK